MEYSRIISKFVNNLQYNDLNENIIAKAKMHFLDSLGNILGAYEMPWSRIVIQIVKQMGGKPQSTVLGEKGKYPMLMAALANGTMAHGIDVEALIKDLNAVVPKVSEGG